jgi:hypothetical protein
MRHRATTTAAIALAALAAFTGSAAASDDCTRRAPCTIEGKAKPHERTYHSTERLATRWFTVPVLGELAINGRPVETRNRGNCRKVYADRRVRVVWTRCKPGHWRDGKPRRIKLTTRSRDGETYRVRATFWTNSVQ